MLLKGKRVFIVEDNASNLAILSVHLRQQGAFVTFERWGAQTVRLIERALPIDIIMLDLMFPNNVSGFDVFDEIKAVPHLAHIPIVAISASDPDIAIPRARSKGFAGFVSKPIPFNIAQHVAHAIEGKKVWITDVEFSA